MRFATVMADQEGRRLPSETSGVVEGALIPAGSTIMFADIIEDPTTGTCWGMAVLPALNYARLYYKIYDRTSLWCTFITEDDAHDATNPVNYAMGGVTAVPNMVIQPGGEMTFTEGWIDEHGVWHDEPIYNDSDQELKIAGAEIGSFKFGAGMRAVYVSDSETQLEMVSAVNPEVYVGEGGIQQVTAEAEYRAQMDELYSTGQINLGDLMQSMLNTRQIKMNISTRLFGSPYQFSPETDPRISSISENVGFHYLTKVLVEAPVVSIIPGKPKYLSGDKDKDTTTTALIEAASGSWDSLKTKLSRNSSKYIRYYDFQRAYVEYMSYVNILCRACASFLELEPTAEHPEYAIDGVSLTAYDWKNYRSDGITYSGKSNGANTVADLLATAVTEQYRQGAALDIYGNWVQGASRMTDTSNMTEQGDFYVITNADGTRNWLSKQAFTSAGDLITIPLGNSETARDLISGKTGELPAELQNLRDTDMITIPRSMINTYDPNANIGLATTMRRTLVRVPRITTLTEADALKAATSYIYPHSDGSVRENTGFVYETTGVGNQDSRFSETFEKLLSSYGYVQFCVDPNITYTEGNSNSTSQSQIKSALEGGSGLMKELAFVMNSSGVEEMAKFQEFADSSMEALASHLSQMSGGSMATGLSRVMSVLGNILKGENLIMPDIYQASQFTKQYSFTVHLKNPHGTKLGYFMNILVPLMHLLALAIPKQTTANTYGSPFLVKVMSQGLFSCNLGIVDNLTVDKNVCPEGWTLDSLPNEVDVSVSVMDLYSDLTMSPQTEPLLFLNNSSLIDYLATQCGLSLLNPNLTEKLKMSMSVIGNAMNIKERFTDAMRSIDEGVHDFALGLMGMS